MKLDPEPPEGYELRDRYTRRRIQYLIPLFPFLFVVFWLFTPKVLHVFVGLGLGGITQDRAFHLLVTRIPGLLAVAAPTLLIHEKVHQTAFELLGYDSELRWGIFGIPPKLENPHVRPLNESVDRDELLIVLLAPLFVVGYLGTIVFFIDNHPWVIFAGKMALLANTLLSYADLYDFIQYSKLPDSSLLHYTTEEGDPRPHIFEPE